MGEDSARDYVMGRGRQSGGPYDNQGTPGGPLALLRHASFCQVESLAESNLTVSCGSQCCYELPFSASLYSCPVSKTCLIPFALLVRAS